MRTRAALVPAVLLLALAACGGPADAGDDGVATANGGTPSATASGDGEKAGADGDQVKFAQCMRENGMTWFKDPEPGQRGVRIGVPPGQDKTKVDAAMAACRKYLPNGGEPGRADPEMLERGRQLAKCMRENGIENFPDPKPDGSIQIDASKLGGGPDSPKFKAAEKACESLLPAGGPGRRTEEKSTAGADG